MTHRLINSIRMKPTHNIILWKTTSRTITSSLVRLPNIHIPSPWYTSCTLQKPRVMRQQFLQIRWYSTDDNKDDKKKEDKDDSNKKEGDKRKKSKFDMWVNLIALGLCIAWLYSRGSSKDFPTNQKTITMQHFFDNILRSPQLDYLEYDVRTNTVFVYLKRNDGTPRNKQNSDYNFTALSVEDFEKKLAQAQADLRIPPSKSVEVRYIGHFDTGLIVGQVIGYGLFFVIIYYLMRGAMGAMKGGPFSMINTAQPVKTQKVKVTFKDVAGMAEAKNEIMEFVHFLKRPKDFTKLGAKIPRGALLLGPPGTGKTLLAKAVAGESNVPFFSMSGSDFVEMYVGVGPARVRDLFSKARKAGTAIIYIDEIDAIGKPRDARGFSSNDERENTLNQLLVEMDGFTKNENIVVMASTNVRAEDLDQALLRPGRFDRQIVIDKPDQHEREDIFKVHMKKLKLADEMQEKIQRLAELTPGFTGAEIANVCNEAALIAARHNKDEVAMIDFEKAIDRVIAGIEKKNMPITPKEKSVIAYHEAGHAICAWFLKFCDPLLKISIIPRGRALGYAQYVPKERFIRTYDQLMDMLTQAFGGRVAERLVFGHLSTGAKDDLQKITRIAYSAVSLFGMSPEIGPVSYPTPEEQQLVKPYSEETAQQIDSEVKKIIDTAYKRAEAILTEKSELLKEIAEYLIKHETMSMEQFKQVAGPRPFPTDEKEKSLEAQTLQTGATPSQEQPSESTQQEQPSKSTQQEQPAESTQQDQDEQKSSEQSTDNEQPKNDKQEKEEEKQSENDQQQKSEEKDEEKKL